MKYTLFIDDEREPYNLPKDADYMMVVARSSKTAKEIVKKLGCPSIIQFDHDLGGEDTSMLFINWLIEEVLNDKVKIPEGFTYTVHSQNPVGVNNIKSKMDSFLEHNSFRRITNKHYQEQPY